MATCYDKSYFIERDVLIPHLAATVKKLMKENKLKKVIDVGCGTGLLVKFLNDNHFQAVGVDSSRQAVQAAQKNVGGKNIILAKATNLPFDDESFDLVTSISMIEHLTLKDAGNFIKEARRVLKKDGFIFLVTPNFSTPLRIIYGKKWFAYKDPTHINFFTPISLSSLLKEKGFKNINFNFKIPYQDNLEQGFPSFFQKFPRWSKTLVLYLLFSTPLSRVRNSFWISAQKV